MCWRIYQKSKPRCRTANKNIICYKRLKGRYNSKVFYPLCYGINTKYILGEKYYATDYTGIIEKPKVYLVVYKEYNIDAGIHSYITLGEARKHFFGRGRVTVKCIIPKGAKYYKNDTEYVSSCIIPKKVIVRKK